MTEDNSLYTSVNPVPKPEKVLILKGKELEQLRRDCFKRDGYKCVDCGSSVSWESGHMAHIIRRKKGGDYLNNVTTKCFQCHIGKEHGLSSKPVIKGLIK